MTWPVSCLSDLSAEVRGPVFWLEIVVMNRCSHLLWWTESSSEGRDETDKALLSLVLPIG